MTDQPRETDGELDPGAYIGSEPEREADSIPRGVSDRDERTSAYDSQPGMPGEPDGAASGGEATPDGTELARHTPEDQAKR